MKLHPLAHFACLALVVAPIAVQAQPLTSEEEAQVDTIVAEALESSGVPSASVAIVRDGKLAFARAYGNLGPNVPVPSTDAKYQIASVSKQFTAAAVLILEDQGKLSLDDTVARYLPGITDGDKITIRQLLSHTSGLQDYWPQDYSFALMEKPTTPQGIVDRWARKPLDFTPGTKWQYSNTGYVVAGMIVEKVSGQKLMPFLQQHIFKPLGMDAINQDLAVGRGFPTGYHRYALGPVRPEKPAAAGWLWAAGELAMSPSDLARWDIARIDRTLLPKEDWDAQETMVRLSDGTPTGYGLGVSIGEPWGRRKISHGGEAVGFLTENAVFPAERFAVAVTVNSDFGGAHSVIADKIEELLLPPARDAAIEDARTELAKATYAALQKGEIDRAMLTDNAAYYFTPQAIGDYRDSLGPLGTPTSFTPLRGPRLRGGFVNRNYMIAYPDRKLVLVTYAEPGAEGRIEQFIVMPAE